MPSEISVLYSRKSPPEPSPRQIRNVALLISFTSRGPTPRELTLMPFPPLLPFPPNSYLFSSITFLSSAGMSGIAWRATVIFPLDPLRMTMLNVPNELTLSG